MSAPPLEKQVDSRSVLHLIQQYLHENNLSESLHALQEETGVLLPGTDDNALNELCTNVKSGAWDKVLRGTVSLALPKKLVHLINEQIFCELASSGQWVAAQKFASQSPALLDMRESQPQRYAQVLRVLGSGPAELLRGGLSMNSSGSSSHSSGSSSSATSASELMSLGSDPARRRARREEIAASIRDALDIVPQSRLLLRLGQALKWQQYQGLLPWSSSTYNLFLGSDAASSTHKDKEDRMPRTLSGKARLGKKSYPLCVAFSPDGNWLITGSVDGFVEVWDPSTCKHRIDLDYQTRDELMLHDRGGVMCAAFSPDSELLCTGCTGGDVKVWRPRSGTLLASFSGAHQAAGDSTGLSSVKSVAFTPDGTSVCSAGTDGIVKLHGLRSCRTLRSFAGHSGEVETVVFVRRNAVSTSTGESIARMVSGGGDGCIKVWDVKTATCLRTVSQEALAKAEEASRVNSRDDVQRYGHLKAPKSNDNATDSKSGNLSNSVTCIQPLPRKAGLFLACNGTSCLYILSLTASVSAHKSSDAAYSSVNSSASDAGILAALSCVPPSRPWHPDNDRLVACALTLRARYAYALRGDRTVISFDLDASMSDGGAGCLESEELEVMDKAKYETHALVSHPHRNMLATAGNDGALRIYVP